MVLFLCSTFFRQDMIIFFIDYGLGCCRSKYTSRYQLTESIKFKSFHRTYTLAASEWSVKDVDVCETFTELSVETSASVVSEAYAMKIKENSIVNTKVRAKLPMFRQVITLKFEVFW